MRVFIWREPGTQNNTEFVRQRPSQNEDSDIMVWTGISTGRHSK